MATEAAPAEAAAASVADGCGEAAFGAGDRVALAGLEARPALNGRLGTLGSFDDIKGRWEVFLDEGEPIKVKPKNLERRAPPEAKFAARMRFDNSALMRLPVDSETKNFIREIVPDACWSRCDPTPLRRPELVARSTAALALLGISEEDLSGQDAALATYFGGREVLTGSEPAAHCYCGHQFGAFSGQLGDGAALYLGEVINPVGERWEVQLKGTGKTPYSRHGDGRTVLRASIREFLCSEAMHHLGVPTTRAGTCVVGDDDVIRDTYGNGGQQLEPCSVISRIAPTFIRFGSFEIFKEKDAATGKAGPSAGNVTLLRQLLDFCIEQYFPDVWAQEEPGEPRYLRFFSEVVQRTCELVASWQAVGWVHGALNTDSMSIVGLTLDYGPFGFMEWFEPDYAPNGSDGGGRYAYREQPGACRFGCERLAEAMGPVLPLERSRAVLETWGDCFQAAYLRRMRAKLGLSDAAGDAEEKDRSIVDQLLQTMEQTCADWTLTFRILCDFDPAAPEATLHLLVGVCAEPKVRASMVERRADMSKASMPLKQVRELREMCQSSPERVQAMFPGSPLETIIDQMKVEFEKAERADAAEIRLRTLRGIDARDQASRDEELWARWLRIYGDRLSSAVGAPRRREAMRAANPAFVPRNWVLQEAIEAAYSADFSRVQALLQRVAQPFEEANANGCPPSGGCDWLGRVLACQSDHYRPPDAAVALLTTWPE